MAGYATPAWANGSSPALNATNLLALGQAVELAQHPYGVCSTAAGTAAKTVTIDFSGALALFTGLRVSVKFTNGNSAANPTLNVNSTGAIPIMSVGTTNVSAIRAGAVLDLIYDGSNWLVLTIDGSTSAKIATGSYAGTGQYTSANPTTLSVGFEPKLVVIEATNLTLQALLVNGATSIYLAGQGMSDYVLHVTWSGTGVSWYNIKSAGNQMNGSGLTYYYVAIG